MGTHPAVAPCLEPRSISPRLFKSDCPSERAHYGRFDLPSEQPAMPTPHSAWVFTGGPRSEKYAERGIQRNASVAIVRFDQRGKSPRAARQQPYLRRLSFQRPARNLRRIQMEVPLLRKKISILVIIRSGPRQPAARGKL